MCAGVLNGRTGILLGFVPLIVYGLLAGKTVQSIVLALGAATAVTVITGYSDLRKGMILVWATLVLFGIAFVAVAVMGLIAIIPWMGVIIYAVLALVAFGSILIKVPFTLQYARQMADRSLWEMPGFIRVNRLMTGVWGMVFTVNLVLSYCGVIMPGSPGSMASLLTYFVLIAGIVFTIWYPGYVQKKYAPAMMRGTP